MIFRKKNIHQIFSYTLQNFHQSPAIFFAKRPNTICYTRIFSRFCNYRSVFNNDLLLLRFIHLKETSPFERTLRLWHPSRRAIQRKDVNFSRSKSHTESTPSCLRSRTCSVLAHPLTICLKNYFITFHMKCACARIYLNNSEIC